MRVSGSDRVRFQPGCLSADGALRVGVRGRLPWGPGPGSAAGHSLLPDRIVCEGRALQVPGQKKEGAEVNIGQELGSQGRGAVPVVLWFRYEASPNSSG